MKMSEKLQEIKKDNKGFSLVELIIVIAIMAILIGIVGMNVIPQIENANVATDAQILSAVVSEATEAWTQVDHAAHDDFSLTIRWNNGTGGDNKLKFAVAGTDASGNGAKIASFMEELEDSARNFKSKAVKDKIDTFTITFSTTTGVRLNADTCVKLEGYEFESR